MALNNAEPISNDDKSEADERATIEFTEPSFKVYTFDSMLASDSMVYYQVLKMESSTLIWIGHGKSPKFSDLSLAMKSSFDTLPLVSKLLGHSMDMSSTSIASRLSRKLGKPVYVSFNIPADRFTLPDIEKRLLEEINVNPDNF